MLKPNPFDGADPLLSSSNAEGELTTTGFSVNGNAGRMIAKEQEWGDFVPATYRRFSGPAETRTGQSFIKNDLAVVPTQGGGGASIEPAITQPHTGGAPPCLWKGAPSGGD